MPTGMRVRADAASAFKDVTAASETSQASSSLSSPDLVKPPHAGSEAQPKSTRRGTSGSGRSTSILTDNMYPLAAQSKPVSLAATEAARADLSSGMNMNSAGRGQRPSVGARPTTFTLGTFHQFPDVAPNFVAHAGVAGYPTATYHSAIGNAYSGASGYLSPYHLSSFEKGADSDGAHLGAASYPQSHGALTFPTLSPSAYSQYPQLQAPVHASPDNHYGGMEEYVQSLHTYQQQQQMMATAMAMAPSHALPSACPYVSNSFYPGTADAGFSFPMERYLQRSSYLPTQPLPQQSQSHLFPLSGCAMVYSYPYAYPPTDKMSVAAAAAPLRGAVSSAASTTGAPLSDTEVFHQYYQQCMRYQQQYVEAQMQRRQRGQQGPHHHQHHHHHPRHRHHQRPHQQCIAEERLVGNERPGDFTVDARSRNASSESPQLTCPTWNPEARDAANRQLSARQRHNHPPQRAIAAPVEAGALVPVSRGLVPACTPPNQPLPPPLDSLMSDDTANTSTSSGGRLTPFNITSYANDHCLLCGEEGHCYVNCHAATKLTDAEGNGQTVYERGGSGCAILCFFNEHDKHVYVMHHEDWANEATLADVISFVEAALHLPRVLCELWVDGRSLATIGEARRENMLLPPRELRTKCHQLRLLPGAVVFVASAGAWGGKASTAMPFMGSPEERDLSSHAPRRARTRVTVSVGSSLGERALEPPPDATATSARRAGDADATTGSATRGVPSISLNPSPTGHGSTEKKQLMASAPEEAGSAEDSTASTAAFVAAPATAPGETGPRSTAPLSPRARTRPTNANIGNGSAAEPVDISSISAVPPSDVQSVPIETLAAAHAAAAKENEGGGDCGAYPSDAAENSLLPWEERRGRAKCPRHVGVRLMKATHSVAASSISPSPQPSMASFPLSPAAANHHGGGDGGDDEAHMVRAWLTTPMHASALAAQAAIAECRARERRDLAAYNGRERRRRRTLHVKFLPDTLPFAEIRSLFTQFGEVLRVRVICPERPVAATLRGRGGFATRPTTAGRSRLARSAAAGRMFYVSFVEYSCRLESEIAQRHLQGMKIDDCFFLSVEWSKQPITGGYRTDCDEATGKPCTFGLTSEAIARVNRHYGFAFPHSRDGGGGSSRTASRGLSPLPASSASSEAQWGPQQQQGNSTPQSTAGNGEGSTPTSAAAFTGAKVEEEEGEGEAHTVQQPTSSAHCTHTTPTLRAAAACGASVPSAPSTRSGGPTTAASASATTAWGSTPTSAKDGASSHAALTALPRLPLPPPLPRVHTAPDACAAEKTHRIAQSILRLFKPAFTAGSREASVAGGGCAAHRSREAAAREVAQLRSALRRTAAEYASSGAEPLFHAALGTARDLLAFSETAATTGSTVQPNDCPEENPTSAHDAHPAPSTPHPVLLRLEALVYTTALHIHRDDRGDGQRAANAAQVALTTVHSFARGLSQLQLICTVTIDWDSRRHSSDERDTASEAGAFVKLPAWEALFTSVPLGSQFTPAAMAAVRDDGVIPPLLLGGAPHPPLASRGGATAEGTGKRETPAQQPGWCVADGEHEGEARHGSGVVSSPSDQVLPIPYPRMDVVCCMMERLLQLALLLDAHAVAAIRRQKHTVTARTEERETDPRLTLPATAAQGSADADAYDSGKSDGPRLQPTACDDDVVVSPLALPYATVAAAESPRQGPEASTEGPSGAAADHSGSTHVTAGDEGTSDRGGEDEEEANELQVMRRVKVELVSVAEQLYRQLDGLNKASHVLREAQAVLHAQFTEACDGPTPPALSAVEDGASDVKSCDAADSHRGAEGDGKPSTEDLFSAHNFWASLHHLVNERLPSCAAIAGASAAAATSCARRRRHDESVNMSSSSLSSGTREAGAAAAAAREGDGMSRRSKGVAGAGVLLTALVSDDPTHFPRALLKDLNACHLL